MMTAQIGATYQIDSDQPQAIRMSICLPETTAADGGRAEAAELAAAIFPKSAKVYGTSNSTFEGRPGGADYRRFHCPLVFFQANLVPNGVNGGINETGLRRYRTMRKALAAAGIEVEWTGGSRNSYRTEAEFEAAVQC